MQINQEQVDVVGMQTPYPQSLERAEQSIIEHVLRLSLDIENHKVFSKANGLPHAFYKKIKSMKMGKSKQTCSVCIEGFKQDEIIKRLPCGHILHSECAKGWLKVNRRCPLCRLDLQLHFRSQQEQAPKELLE